MSVLLDPFAYGFFARAMAAAVLIGALCGAVGVFVVLRRMSYIGHGLAHSVLGGVAVGLALGAPALAGAVAATLVSALLIDRVARRRGLYPDAAIGIVTTVMFALGVAMLALLGGARVNLEALLFGSILAVTGLDVALAAATALLFGAALFFAGKRLVFAAFDPQVALVHGVRLGAAEVLFNVLVAGVVVVGVRLLGVLLVSAALVIPAATARLLTYAFGRLVVVAIAVGVLMSVAGLYASYYLGVPSGAAIVLSGGIAFLGAAIASTIRTRGQLADARRVHAAAGATVGQDGSGAARNGGTTPGG